MQSELPDLYLPKPAIIEEVIIENSQIKTFVLSFAEKKRNETFTYQPGQFVMVSTVHCGEAPLSFSSTPTRKGTFHLSVRKAGKLTGALHDLSAGDIVGVRGPYGNSFPVADLKGKNLLFVAGGIGLAPLRSVIQYCLDNRTDYGTISILYGSKEPSDIAFKADIETWQQSAGIECLLTVDKGDAEWQGTVGVVTCLFDACSLDSQGCKALVCGPPMMIRSVLADLNERGFADEDILTTMERHMKCGIGICRHCHMDEKLVCADGPVFTLKELRSLDVMELAS